MIMYLAFLVVPRPGFEPGFPARGNLDTGSRGPHTWPGYTTAAPDIRVPRGGLKF